MNCMCTTERFVDLFLLFFLHLQQQIYTSVCAKDNKQRYFSIPCIVFHWLKLQPVSWNCFRALLRRRRYCWPVTRPAYFHWCCRCYRRRRLCLCRHTWPSGGSIKLVYIPASFICLLVFRAFYCCLIFVFATQLLSFLVLLQYYCCC